jgi:hypothetical protein
MTPDFERVAAVISAILTRMVLAHPSPKEDDDADDRVRESLD